MSGTVLNCDGLSKSWSDFLLDFISIVTTHRYIKTILDVKEKNSDGMLFCNNYLFLYLMVKFHNDTMEDMICVFYPCYLLLRYWTGVWAVVHVGIVRNAIDILCCVLHPFLYNFKSIYIG